MPFQRRMTEHRSRLAVRAFVGLQRCSNLTVTQHAHAARAQGTPHLTQAIGCCEVPSEFRADASYPHPQFASVLVTEVG